MFIIDKILQIRSSLLADPDISYYNKITWYIIVVEEEGKRMKKNKLSFIAVLSVFSMTVTSVLPAMAAPAADDAGRAGDALENQVLDLEFEGELTDGTDTIADISISGDGYEYVDGVNGGQALSLTGSTYVNLGKDERLQPENLTLSFWINPNETITGEQIISWNKQEYNTDGWYLTSENDNTPLALSVGEGANGGQPYKVSVKGNRAEFFPAGEWTHIVVTYDSETKDVAFYRNGEAQSVNVDYAVGEGRDGVLGSDPDMEKSIGYNGPVYGYAFLNAALDHYELFNDTATAEQALALYEENKETETSGLKNQVLDLEFEDNLTDGTGINTDIKFSGSGYEYVEGANGGKALELTGNTYIDLGKNTDLQPKNLTLSFWINPEQTMTGEGIISWNKNEYCHQKTIMCRLHYPSEREKMRDSLTR